MYMDICAVRGLKKKITDWIRTIYCVIIKYYEPTELEYYNAMRPQNKKKLHQINV